MNRFFLRSTMLSLAMLTACGQSSKNGQGSAMSSGPGTPQEQSRAPLGRIGFHHPNNANLPAAVRTASAAVFRIVTPGGSRTTVEAIFGRHPIDAIIARVTKTPLSADLNQGDKDFFLFQLRHCAKQADAMSCEMFEGDLQSSAYLVGNGTRLRTAFHAVHTFAELQLSNAKVAGPSVAVPMLVLIYDSSGKLVSSPETDHATVEFKKSNLDSTGNTGSFTLPNDDLAEIRLGRPLGQPLRRATVRPKVGEPIFIVGYPKHTDDRQALGGEDAPGAELRVSSGHVISMDEFARKEGLQPAALTEQTKGMLRQMVVSDADGAPGLSGGAIVNSRGEVIGTYTAGNPADGTASVNHISYGSTH